MLQKKGQISLEFLIVISVSIAILLVFMPVFNKIYDSTLFSLDLYESKKVLDEISKDISILSGLADGSFFTIKVKPISKYELSCSGQKLTIEIKSNKFNKKLSSDVALECEGNIVIDKQKKITITKNNNKVQLT